MQARRSYIDIEYEGTTITKEVMVDLVSFTYTDNASGSADDVNITLKDDHKKWVNSWYPSKGDTLKVDIRTVNWYKNGEKRKLPCGRFMVDEPEYSGRPRNLNIKAISIPANSNLLSTPKSQVWRRIRLKNIASEIAKRYGLQLVYESDINPLYDLQEQTETSDSSFLSERCSDEGLAYKVTDKQIVIFDEEIYEKRKSVATFKESESSVLSYSFQSTYTNTAYAGCNVKYLDSSTGKTIQYLFAIKDDIDLEKDKIFQVNKRVKGKDEAVRLAKKTLRNLNKKEYTGSIELVGDIRLLGGCCIDLVDFGVFSGKYYIDKATHTQSSGYTTSLELHKVLEGY